MSSLKKFQPSPADKKYPAGRNKLKVKIEDLNEAGEGVAFYKKLKINVEKTLPGEEVLIEYHRERPRKDRIRLLKILEPSPHRREAPCPYFRECGGCQLQHLEYSRQLLFKQQQIQRLLLAYPALKHIIVHPPEGMPEPFYYRNKTQMPFKFIDSPASGGQQGNAIFGLFRAGTHEVIPIEQCLVESRDANRALQIIRDWANRFRISIYDETRHQGLLRHAVIRKGIFTHQLMVILAVAAGQVPHLPELLREMKAGLPSLHGVQINVNAEKTNLILGEQNIPAWGEPYIEERLGRRRYRVYPPTFFQVNSVQMVRLLDKLAQIAGFQPGDTVVDLYCGVGTIALHLADKVKQVIGVESNPTAVSAAVQNAADNNAGNAEFFSGDVRQKFRELWDGGLQPEGIIVDPPRKGIAETLIREICAAGPRTVVYLSCNPQTLARDLEIFDQAGYRCKEIFPFDMFPQTYHVESLAVLNNISLGG